MVSTSDFEYMGLGIERRFARCAAWWAPHLSCSREFIARYSYPASSIAVLGAGRLLDVDLQRLLTRCEIVHLFDADPRCVSVWKRQAGDLFGRRVVPHIGDLTRSLETWTRGLPAALRTRSLDEYLLSLQPDRDLQLGQFDGIISLNLLGQLPLYWRDKVQGIVRDLEVADCEALVHSMGELQNAHLHLLHQSGASWSVVISDTEYYFYDIDASEWRVEPALFGSGRESWLNREANAELIAVDSWLWHIAPQLIEAEDEGEIHRVEARLYRY